MNKYILSDDYKKLLHDILIILEKNNHRVELYTATFTVINHIYADNTMCFYQYLYELLQENDNRFYKFMNTYTLYSAIFIVLYWNNYND